MTPEERVVRAALAWVRSHPREFVVGLILAALQAAWWAMVLLA